MSTKIKSFTDLVARQVSHELVKEIYKLTGNFPRSEDYALTSQMRRCVVSIMSNIAEGFSRRSKKEKAHFLHIALGSLTELQNQLLVTRDVGYCDKEAFSKIADKTVRVSKLINGLIKSIKDAYYVLPDS